jgi:ATP-dependent RNA helicase DDX1
MDIPVDEFDGKVIYGEKRKQEGLIDMIVNPVCSVISILVPASKGHVDSLASTVQELVALEKRVQTSFFALRNCRNLMTTS